MKLTSQNVLKYRHELVLKLYDILDSAILYVTNQYNLVFITNVFNPFALDIMLNGEVPKLHLIKETTEKAGVLSGYIVVPPCDTKDCRPIEIYANNKKYYYDRRSLNLIDKNLIEKQHVSFGLTNEKQNFITSDLDVLSIYTLEDYNFSYLSSDFGMGDIVQYAYTAACAINAILKKRFKTLNKQTQNANIITHGPLNRYHKATTRDINFPVSIYHPRDGKFILGSCTNRTNSFEELLKYFQYLKRNKWKSYIPKNWMQYSLQN